MKLEFFSEQDSTVTGSKHFLRVNDKYIILDYGIWQGTSDDLVKNKEFVCPIPIDQIETVLVSHAHADHCGLLPKLVKEGYEGKIRSTPATRDLAAIIMLDSAKIQKRSNKRIILSDK